LPRGSALANTRDQRHIDGDLCELLVAEHFVREGYFIFMASQGSSPIDLIAVNEHGVRLLQVKKDSERVSPGRLKASRIHRGRTDLQKQLGVEMVYVNLDTRVVTVTDHEYHANRKAVAAANDNEKAPE
jgi:hypothetical protein